MEPEGLRSEAELLIETGLRLGDECALRKLIISHNWSKLIQHVHTQIPPTTSNTHISQSLSLCAPLHPLPHLPRRGPRSGFQPTVDAGGHPRRTDGGSRVCGPAGGPGGTQGFREPGAPDQGTRGPVFTAEVGRGVAHWTPSRPSAASQASAAPPRGDFGQALYWIPAGPRRAARTGASGVPLAAAQRPAGAPVQTARLPWHLRQQLCPLTFNPHERRVLASGPIRKNDLQLDSASSLLGFSPAPCSPPASHTPGFMAAARVGRTGFCLGDSLSGQPVGTDARKLSWRP